MVPGQEANSDHLEIFFFFFYFLHNNCMLSVLIRITSVRQFYFNECIQYHDNIINILKGNKKYTVLSF